MLDIYKRIKSFIRKYALASAAQFVGWILSWKVKGHQFAPSQSTCLSCVLSLSLGRVGEENK